MVDQPISDKELEVLLGLLQSERRELGPELHHTTAARVKEELRERMRTVERLIEHFSRQQSEQQAPAGPDQN